MRMQRYYILISFIIAACHLSSQNLNPDSVKAEVESVSDSLYFKVTAFQIETQLSFLMQGVTISIIQPDTLTMSFPSAMMVRNKVKRHPNEVKAVLTSRQRQEIGRDSMNHVVRPDVQPLVAALNDTTAMVYYQGKNITTRDFNIDVDREKAIMCFAFRLNKKYFLDNNEILNLFISSKPSNNGERTEFRGKKLSGENAPRPNGLGEGIKKEDVQKRSFQKAISIRISKNYGE